MMRNAEIEGVLSGTIVSRRPSAYRTSYPIDEIDFKTHDGGVLHLLLKDLRRESLADTAASAKPAFLHDPDREIDAYTTLLGGVAGPPRCFASSRRPPWLLLERVAGRELYQIGEVREWARAAAWLVHFHTSQVSKADAWRDHPALSDQWLRRALATRSMPLLERVLKHWPRLMALLQTQPTTVLHGEFYASNILLDGDRVVAVDWEMTSRGPGVLDLAALIAGDWSDADRGRMVAAYNSDSSATFGDALAAARLLVAVQWLGWSDDWTPPAATDHDWLADVAEQCERLGLA